MRLHGLVGTRPGAARNWRIGLPARGSQRRTSPSQLPEARVLPSGRTPGCRSSRLARSRRAWGRNPRRRGRPCRRRWRRGCLPSGPNARRKTAPPKPPTTLVCLASSSGFQTRSWLSLPPVMTAFPSGAKLTQKTVSSWPGKVARTSFFSASKTLLVLSRLAVAIRLPSGLQARSKIQSAWSSIDHQFLARGHVPDPDRPVGAGGGELGAVRAEGDGEGAVDRLGELASGRQLALGPTAQSRTEPYCPGSPPAVANHLPSGLKATSWVRSAIPRVRSPRAPSATFQAVTSW